MLELADSLTGKRISFASGDGIQAGRYYLTKEAFLSTHGSYPAGTPLVDDGRGFIEVDGISLEFPPDKKDAAARGERIVALLALKELASIADLQDPESLPSPVIPPEIAHQFEHSKLEDAVIEVLKQGHLHLIAKSPRISMRYDEELLPVSRVKRMASDYQRHLAAHSECWQQRTFTGIIPKKLKAKISEDEVHIYENRVYARLLDHLERYALEKLSELQALNKTLAAGMDLDGSDALHRSLRHALCDTWGEAFSLGEAEELRTLSESQIEAFEDVLRKTQQLKQSPTYRAIPRQSQVPLALKSTNILNNDPHYLKVRELWELWVHEIASHARDPHSVFEERLTQCRNFETYTGLLLVRAHQKLGWIATPGEKNHWDLKHPSGIQGTLSCKADLWTVSRPSAQNTAGLEFVPCIDLAADSIPSAELPANRYVCTLEDIVEPAQFIYCSPENLFTEESIIQVVQQWWVKQVAIRFGEEIKPLPKVLSTGWPNHQPKGRFKSNPNLADSEFIEDLKGQNLSDELRRDIQATYQAAQFVSYCPCCGKKVLDQNFTVRDDRAFIAECICGSEWQIRWTGSKWQFEIGSYNDSTQDQAGRWSGKIDV